MQSDKTTTDLTKILEDYGLQAAAGQKNANDLQRVVKDNLGNCSRNTAGSHRTQVPICTVLVVHDSDPDHGNEIQLYKLGLRIHAHLRLAFTGDGVGVGVVSGVVSGVARALMT